MSGLETWSLPLASPNGATACSQRLQSGRSDVADWCIVLFQFQCCDRCSTSLLAEPENSRNSADSTTGWDTTPQVNSRIPRWRSSKRASDRQWGTDKPGVPALFNRTLGRDPERKLLAGLCGHRPPLAFTWWANVPSIQWYFRGHGRTSPDLELCANRCAIHH